MFRALYRDLRHHITTRKPTPIHFNIFNVLQNQNPHLKFISQIHESTHPPSFTVDHLFIKKTVDHLENSRGLPPQTALYAAKKTRLCSTERADSVISLLESCGLTKTQITKLISQHPSLLLYDTEKNLRPKIEFLYGLGFSGPDLLKLIASNSTFLFSSLQNQIIPSFSFIMSYIHTNADILIVFKRCPRIFLFNLEKVLIPNISILQDNGFSDCNISKFFITQPRTLTLNSNRFKEIIETVKEIGFDPSRPMFSKAVCTMAGLSKSSWERKVMVYREFGWSDNEILSGFKKQPNCMKMSEEKIRIALEFFMEKFNWKPSEILLCPTLLVLSSEKRIMPRCAVLKILYSKGMIRKKLNLGTVLKMAERDFLKKFLIKYQEIVPEVMKAHKGGIEFAGFGEAVEVKGLSIKASINHITPVVTAV
ncbi:Mitochodrial transcription termination factor-related [Macleaya cordata]|uniref:Mitochodrial transcription termination factor-related n=1 Tax=Macleaya cordata TaxID=56857 RepID=A0A200PVQ1_MACCD|nr:Mitochodrial transcription termination factor-related [Macleaya cordata]